jgi:hypothetical protein
MNDDRTRKDLADWLGDVIDGTTRELRWTLARSGVDVVNRLMARELRNIARQTKDPAARFDLYARADQLHP